MQINSEYGVEGYFRIVVRKAETGAVVSDSGLFKNIITNYGMNFIAGFLGGSGVFSGCTVGNGTTPESITDVSIQSFVARTNTFAPSGNPSPAVGSTTSPFYAKCTATWRFPQGAAVGNLTEVGVIANYIAPNYQLWSRTLIKDVNGNPITITVLADEILDVYYEARLYPQEIQTTGSITISGSSYAYKVGSSDLTSFVHAAAFLRGFGPSSTDACSANTGTLTASPSFLPSGTILGNRSAIAGVAYVADSFSKGTTYTFAPGIATGSIRSFSITGNPQGPSYSIELTPAYVKAATFELKVTHTVTWARRSI